MSVMKEISITGSGLRTMCRLCLSSDVILLDIFLYSSKMKNRVAGVIMKSAAVQITRGDEMPNFICESCYTQLEKTHYFVVQIEHSDRTLRRYLQQLYGSVQPSKDPLLHNTNKDITVKCESLKLDDVDRNWTETEPANFLQENKSNEEVPLKSEIKDERMDDNLFLTTDCESGPEDISSNIYFNEDFCEDSKIDIGETKVDEAMLINWKEKEEGNHSLTNKVMRDKFEMKVEQTDDILTIPTRPVDDTEHASTSDNINDISCEDTKIGINHASETACFRSANLSGTFSKLEETNKNLSKNQKNHKKVNKLKSYQCDVCDKTFVFLSDFNLHKLKHTGEKPYQCELCEKCYSQQSDLNIHKRIHTGEEPFRCDRCNKYFSNSSNLKKHERIHTGEKRYRCDRCKKCFTQLSHLNDHKRIHTGAKPYQCDLCNKCFSRSFNLSEHKRTHTGEKPYQCDICKKCFVQTSQLNIHKRIHTGEKSYRCDICNKCFSYLSVLNNHKRMHSGEKPYQCDLCKMCFTQSGYLNIHKRIHTGEKPYRCDLCNKCFSHSSVLNKHKRMHTGEKPYKCDLCKKCFTQSDHLKLHKRIHTGEKPYRCDLCNKCFSRSFVLNKHKRVHTGEKPYQCDICKKCFTQSGHLNIHKRIHTGEKPY